MGRWKCWLAFAAGLLLSACATLKAPPPPQDGFSASGRLVIRAGKAAHYAHFGWQAAAQGDRLSLSNPLGQVLAELEIHYSPDQPPLAVLREADGGVRTGAPEALLAERVDMALPINGLRWWLQGLPAPGAAQSRDTDEGRLIEQDGWLIEAKDFEQTQPQRRGPRRVELTRGDVWVRIVISEWQWTSVRP